VPAQERIVDVLFVGYEPRCHGASSIRCCAHLRVSADSTPPPRQDVVG
jgi:hypothetical protein